MSEEAKCATKEACKWSYTSELPEIKDLQSKWDDEKKYWTVVATGTGFTGTAATTLLKVQGMP